MFAYRICVTTLVVAFAIGVSQSAADTLQNADTSGVQINQWIGQLDSNEFSLREKATRQLVESGRTAIPSIVEAVKSDRFEVSWRAASILEQIGLNGDDQTLAIVVAEMKKLNDAGNKSFAKTYTELVGKWRQVRHDRAASKLRHLGIEIQEMPGIWGGGGVFIGGFGGGFEVADAGFVEIDLPEAPAEVADLTELIEEIKSEVQTEEPIEPVDEPDRLIEVNKPVVEAADDSKVTAKEDVPIEKVAEPKDGKGDTPRLGDVVAKFDAAVKKVERLVEGDDVVEVHRPVIVELEDVDEIALDDLVIDEGFAIAPPMLMGGDFIWSTDAASSQTTRTVTLRKSWKGTDEDLTLLANLDRVTVLSVEEFELSDLAVANIARMPNLQRVSLTNSNYDRELMIGLKRQKPQLSIYAIGQSILGVSGEPHERGFHVTNVVSKSGAHKAGIRNNDIISVADGIALKSLDELLLIVAQKKIGDSLVMRVVRDGKVMSMDATLGSRADAQVQQRGVIWGVDSFDLPVMPAR